MLSSVRLPARIVAIGFAAALAACGGPTATQTKAPLFEVPTKPQSQDVRGSNSQIRQVDFRSFTPPKNSCSQKIEVKNGLVRFIHETAIRQGEVGAAFINYADVTGDGKEDAFVVVAVETAGSAIPYCVYIYANQEKARPKLIWSFLTGDRADDGLRQVYAAGQQLILELYSPEDSKGACCPTKFRRITFTWSGNRFQQVGKPELFVQSHDDGAFPIMPEYSKP